LFIVVVHRCCSSLLFIVVVHRCCSSLLFIVVVLTNFKTREITGTTGDISLATQFTTNIRINLPLVSSPMDTVTESEMAIELALQGGIGVIHCNLSIEKQTSEVEKVKRYNNGFILNPIVMSPNDPISKIIETKSQWHFSGFPVTVDGKMSSTLLGSAPHRLLRRY
jgi:hypothetical protein